MTTATPLGEVTGDYVLDTARTRIGFTARAALVSKVRGDFEAFDGGARLDGGTPSASSVRLTVRTASVRTRNRKRDEHLRGGDFLDVGTHPVLTFASTGVEQVGPAGFQVTGDLTVRGVTRPVTVDFTLTGAGADSSGSFRASFLGRAVIDRADWGVSGGGAMIGRKVTLEFDVTAVRQP
ncbi:YceI family protein [Streptomyces sp. DSM 41921]|uniref:YceI family protein n=1 Tax=Streptomyces dubilierae TaxID=3075533 RepID=A0ABU2PE70_9ACTN|nr:YceI family protein [Streptomyces sp. DSM 41921]MDT0389070.1 YceI family protein [Streptomyces sp. DSM 41921]